MVNKSITFGMKNEFNTLSTKKYLKKREIAFGRELVIEECIGTRRIDLNITHGIWSDFI